MRVEVCDVIRRGVTLLLALGMPVACTETDAEGRAASRAESDPEATFRDLENRLLEARRVHLDFEITAEGAVEVALEGRLEIDAGSEARLTAAGTFAGQAVDVLLETEDQEYVFGSVPDRVQAPVPPQLVRALLVGMTRMGLLHNLARLTADAPPDHADGAVESWVVVDDFTIDAEDRFTVGFAITVGGQPSGSATLAVDGEGRPLVRHQTVNFPQGEMRVEERYSNVVVEQ